MLNDVTFGQYYPAKSFVHNMDPRAKLVLVIAYIVAIFLASNFYALAAVTLFLVIAVTFSPFSMGKSCTIGIPTAVRLFSGIW